MNLKLGPASSRVGSRALLALVPLIWLTPPSQAASQNLPSAAAGTSAGPSEPFSCSPTSNAAGGVRIFETTLAGVPAILRAPPSIRRPPIILWHGFATPASEAELMRALPLDETPAVKVYLGLPLFGARAPSAAEPSIADRQSRDFAALVFEPIVVGAAKELPRVVRALREKRCLGPKDGIGLFGFSAGGAAALFALAERDARIDAAVVVNAPVGLTVNIQALEHATGQPYAWTPAARRLAERADVVGRAKEMAAGQPPPALLIIHGADDPVISPQGAVALDQALKPFYQRSGASRRLKLQIIPGVSHNWAATPEGRALSASISDWFNRYP